tara:strand:+ start:277 stop:450 length:174 start_codon:yes stop_codon:yes gene_type:complete
MKVGDLVMWYSEDAQDTGIIIKLNAYSDRIYVHWVTGDGNGWFDNGHPSIGVISESR